MADSSIKDNPMPAEALCAAVATASYVCAVRNSVLSGCRPLSVICGTAAVITVYFIFRATMGKRRLPAMLPLLFLYITADPAMLSFGGGHIAVILTAVALFLTSRKRKYGGGDTAACASALIIAASLFIPPLVWILAAFIAYTSVKTRGIKNLPAVAAGAAITLTAAGCIIFLVEGAEGAAEFAGSYIYGIADVSLYSVSFCGWRSVEKAILLAVAIVTIIRYLLYRTRASAAEAAISGSLGILICSSLLLALLYGNFSGDILIPASAMSAFMISALPIMEVERKGSVITMYIIALAAACAAVSEIYPEMNGIFPYLCNITSL